MVPSPIKRLPPSPKKKKKKHQPYPLEDAIEHFMQDYDSSLSENENDNPDLRQRRQQPQPQPQSPLTSLEDQEDEHDSKLNDFSPLIPPSPPPQEKQSRRHHHHHHHHHHYHDNHRRPSKQPMATFEIDGFQTQQDNKDEQHPNNPNDYYSDYDGDNYDNSSFSSGSSSLSSSSSSKDEVPETCMDHTWRLVASAMLAALMMTPVMYRMHHDYYNNNHSTNKVLEYYAPPLSPNLDTCADELQISYQASFQHIVEQSSSSSKDASLLCSEHLPPSASCHCKSPLIPRKHVPGYKKYADKWDTQFQINQQHVQDAIEKKTNNNNNSKIEVVFVGDSITEQWSGTELSIPVKQDIGNVFQELFSTPPHTALPLGIAGDRCEQLLFRLQQGEYSSQLQPKVWWILIGTNDLSDHCSSEAVLVGILNIVQWFLHQFQVEEQLPLDQTPWIVINSLLPRPSKNDGTLLSTTAAAAATTTTTTKTSHTNHTLPQDDTDDTTTPILTLWDQIQWINARLECYCQNMDRVLFFNATPLFVEGNTTPPTIIQQNMPDWLHPSALGAQKWGQEILKTLETLL